jgi:hypothetical protein
MIDNFTEVKKQTPETMYKFYNFLILFFPICCSNFCVGQSINLHYQNEQSSIQGSIGSYSLDIMIQSDESTSFGGGKLYFDYNSNAFGTNAVSSGNISLSVPNGYWLAQMDNNSGTVKVYSDPKISDISPSKFQVTWDQVIEGACMDNLPVGMSEALFHLELTYTPNGVSYPADFCFSQDIEGELFTACGNNTNCSVSGMNCTLFPGVELTDISYDCTSVIVPCPGNIDEDGDGLCVGADCDDNDPNIGGAGSPCNDGNDCTINDVFDSYCNCLGVYQDGDDDGVCDGQDQCEGFDDNIDFNNNGIPDGCENGADPNCISFSFIPQNKTIDCEASPVFDEPIGIDNCCSNPDLSYSYVDSQKDLGCTKKIVRIWIAESACGNKKTVKQTITLVDTQAPKFIIDHPLFGINNDGDTLTLDCTDNLFIVPGNIKIKDNCDEDASLNMYDQIDYGHCPSDGYLKFLYCYWVAEDACGNRDTFDIYVKFIDTTAPEIICPSDIEVECTGSIDPSITGLPSVKDNCTDVLTTYSDETTQSNTCKEVITRTWYAEDDCKNIDSCKQIITIIDTEIPDINCPADITIDCVDSTDPSNTGVLLSDDACGNTTTTYTDEFTILSDCEQEILRTWVSSDDCNNTATCSQVIQIQDLNAPEIKCPQVIIIECSDGSSPDLTGYPTVSDLCDSNLDLTYSDDTSSVNICEFIIDRTWTATDDCGNTSTCVQLIKVIDSNPPVILCPNDITIECGESIEPSNTGELVATDLCDSDLEIWYEDAFDSKNCTSIITRTVLVIDNCGNSSDCIQIITITDTENPVINCPADVSIECNMDHSPYNQGFATSTDNCDSDITIEWTDEVQSSNDCKTAINRTWTATDNCGNYSSCVQTILIIDTTPPINTCPQDLTVECNDSLDPAVLGEPFAFDNCDPDLEITYSDEVTSSNDCQNLIERTWLAIDNCGNTGNCVQYITTIDTQMPSISCPPDMNLSCDESFDPSITGQATATDDCDTDIEITYFDQVTGGYCTTTINRIWTATDNCGNVDQCMQTLTITDSNPPEITCPSDVTLECDMPKDPQFTGTPNTTDNCDVDPFVTWSDEINTISNCQYEIIRTWSSMDDCGNEATCIQIITVIDTGLPTIICPADLTISCNESSAPNNTGLASSTDACDPQVEIIYSDLVNTSNCSLIIERTWTATDDCGNEATCIQIITVTDTEAPQINCADDKTIECDKPLQFDNPTLADNCDIDVQVTFATDTTMVSPCELIISRTWTATDDCGNNSQCQQSITIIDATAPEISCPSDIELTCNASTSPANTGVPIATDNCDPDLDMDYTDVTKTISSCETTIERTWTATDDCGNTTSCVQIITIIDDIAPVLDCPAGVTINCEESSDPANTGQATATDNCDSAIVTYTDSLDQISNCELDIYRTWIAADDCGNTTSCVQVIKVLDLEAPNISCPIDVTIECDASSDPQNLGFATASDNCDTNVDVTYADELKIVDECISQIHRTWTATDDCGLTATCMQIITIKDTQKPIITCPADVTLECNETADPNTTGLATETDNCDQNVTITYNDENIQVSDCQYVINRTWTAIDDCGNATSCVQIITVTDQTPPAITCPSDLTIQCDASTDPALTGQATATDICDQNVDITYYDKFVSNSNCDSFIERTWTAKDDCGNQASCIQIINTIDMGVPTINCPQDKVIECTDSTDPNETGEPFAFDNCDPTVDLSYSDVVVVIDDCTTEIQRTWTSTDDCGNEATCIQTITITDQSSPSITSCPSDITIECGSSTDPLITGTATGTDNCTTDLDVSYTDDTNPVDSCTILITRTWTVTDDCGNTETCIQKITLTDTTAPELTFNNPLLNNLNHCDTIQIECNSFDFFNENDVIATDICDSSPTVLFTETAENADCTIDGIKTTLTCSWIAIDNCGNQDTLKVIVQIIDTTPPTITPNHPMINGAQDGDTLVVDCENFWFLGEDDIIVEDACGDVNVTLEEEIYQADCTTNGGLKVTMVCSWIGEDDCGNADTLTLTFMVVDTTAPQLIGVPSDTILLCAEVTDPLIVTAIDGCDGNPIIEFNEYTNPPYGNSATCELVREWTATDECGNTSTQIQVITIPDCVGCFLNSNPYFIAVNADTDGQQTYLDWEFSAVTMNHLFAVQRSADNEHFYNIGIIEGRLNFNTESDNYEFIDEEPRLGNNFYRIRALNIGDTPINSDTMVVRYLNDPESRDINYQIYPNPTFDEVTIELLFDNLEEGIKINVHNELGILISEEIIPNGSTLKKINLKDQPAGVYFITIEFDNQRMKIERIIKLD